MANPSTYTDVLKSFESMPMSKYILDADLIKQWFEDALGIYELEIESLDFDDVTETFPIALPSYVKKTIALIMYTSYLTRELSRVEKLNGIIGKDISMTGMDATKRVTLSDLQLEMTKAEDMLNKQKQHCFS